MGGGGGPVALATDTAGKGQLVLPSFTQQRAAQALTLPSVLSWKLSTRAASVHLAATSRAAFRRRSCSQGRGGQSVRDGGVATATQPLPTKGAAPNSPVGSVPWSHQPLHFTERRQHQLPQWRPDFWQRWARRREAGSACRFGATCGLPGGRGPGDSEGRVRLRARKHRPQEGRSQRPRTRPSHLSHLSSHHRTAAGS